MRGSPHDLQSDHRRPWRCRTGPREGRLSRCISLAVEVISQALWMRYERPRRFKSRGFRLRPATPQRERRRRSCGDVGVRNDDGLGRCFCDRSEPRKQRRRCQRTGELNDDECRRVARPDPGEGVGERSRDRDGRVRERGRRGKPVGGHDVRGHRKRRRVRTRTHAPPDHRKQSESRDELAYENRRARSYVARCEKEGQSKHPIRKSAPPSAPAT